MKKNPLLILAVVAMFTAAGAASEPGGEDNGCLFSGIVKDSLGNRLPQASVLIEETGQLALTDEEGRFCFNTAPEGKLTILAALDGFEERWMNEVSTGNGTIEIVLEPARIRESITVTAATRTEKRLEDVPIRTEVVMPEIIEMSSAKTLADAVEFTPGIRVENSCQNCNFSSIRMLGLQGPYTQILFDGQPTISSLAQV